MPCGDCTACCTSAYFIHIGPEEKRTLSRIPRELLFPAPGLPKGNVVMGYDEQGRCPMLIDNRCSIYEDRPMTCRKFDCRIFPAAGLAPGGADKALITEHVERWAFGYPDTLDRKQHAAVLAAAVFLRQHPECFPDRVAPSNPLQLALLAIRIADIFLPSPCEAGETEPVTPDVEAVMSALSH